jgi:hypothetical protein
MTPTFSRHRFHDSLHSDKYYHITTARSISTSRSRTLSQQSACITSDAVSFIFQRSCPSTFTVFTRRPSGVADVTARDNALDALNFTDNVQQNLSEQLTRQRQVVCRCWLWLNENLLQQIIYSQLTVRFGLMHCH